MPLSTASLIIAFEQVFEFKSYDISNNAKYHESIVKKAPCDKKKKIIRHETPTEKKRGKKDQVIEKEN